MSMNRDFSILDANLARVKEGLRVLEDTARFVFADRELFEAIKILRHSLSQVELWFGTGHMMQGRFGADVGESPVVKDEYQRSSLYSIIRANCSRVIEALRSLEEFAKIYSNKNSFFLEKARYQMYALERDLVTRTPHFWLYQYFEEGLIYPLGDTIEEIKDFIDAGAKIVQLRDKNGSKKLIFEKTKEICRYLYKREKEGKEKVIFILNDHVDIAAKLPVDGVHIGQEDGEILHTRFMIGSNKIIGRSTHSYAQAETALLEGADYIGVGPIYATPTKEGRPSIGFDDVEKVQKNLPIPFYAVGGIDSSNLYEVYKRGIKNIAVVRSARELFGIK